MRYSGLTTATLHSWAMRQLTWSLLAAAPHHERAAVDREVHGVDRRGHEHADRDVARGPGDRAFLGHVDERLAEHAARLHHRPHLRESRRPAGRELPNDSFARAAIAAFSARTSSTNGSSSGSISGMRQSLHSRCAGGLPSGTEPSDAAATIPRHQQLRRPRRGGPMRGIVYDGESTTLVEGLELRAPGPREVVVEIVAAGMCHSDLSFMSRPLPRGRCRRCAGTRAPGSSPRWARRSPT